MKLVTVIGARPQYIKAAPVSRALATAQINEVLVDTGQHFDRSLSKVFLEELEIGEPHHTLGIACGTHAEMTGRMLPAIEKVLIVEQPNSVLVYGDTNSALAGALAAAKLAIPIVHVEAGLRSFQPSMPEEINRRLVDHLSSVLFCPTQVAVDNLAREGIGGVHDRLHRRVDVVGDVMVDALRLFGNRPSRHPHLAGLDEKSYVLVTVHRAEMTDSSEALRNLVEQLAALAGRLTVVLPLHPRTRRALADLCLIERLGRVRNLLLLEPLGYVDFSAALRRARAIVTDSGGVQKEAAVLGVPCLTLRTETEWPETIESGWNRLVGRKPEGLTALVQEAAAPAGGPLSVYGEGEAAQRIAQHLRQWSACV
jgi:UDP-N-acetylglucosamine 2-epimerase